MIESTKAASRWTTRIVPLFLAAAVGYATYVVVARVCVQYLLGPLNQHGAAVAILVLYFFFFLLMVSCYARTLYNANANPGAAPLGPRALERLNATRGGKRMTQTYGANDPNSPGLEAFYSRDVFVCETDGRPKWCSECCNWKQDRVHHSREVGRCIHRMDHYCPWAGGMIALNSFKFFVQFVSYTAMYCAVVLGSSAYVLKRQVEHSASPDPYLIAILAISGFFGVFSFMMALMSARYIFMNVTNVDILTYRQKVYTLAVRVPRGTRGSEKFAVIQYPLSGPPTSERKSGVNSPAEDSSATSRDDLATRTFAILSTYPGENPWDLGYWRNFKMVMGTNPVDWLLPIRHSPCTNHESSESLYPMDAFLDRLRSRFGLATGHPSDESTVVEMRAVRGE
ncbi:DHHC palmitoyltransferase-domain-containing protein [Astrocystis sublimbata]|nr:DHHC palmitoyltransferase-domain-containing protein [Astrocystis sublimbata]